MKIKIFAGFVVGVAVTTAVFLAGSADAIVQDPEPVITSIAPNQGYTTGGEAVTITGRYLDEVSEVLFGVQPAEIESVSSNAVVVKTPANPTGYVDVTVTNPVASITSASAYEYITLPPPSVLSVSPSSGPIEGGTEVIISGTYLEEVQEITFGGMNATIIGTSDSQITVSTPAHEEGFVEVIVSTPYGSTNISDGYEYINDSPPPTPKPPTISDISPNQGPVEGGTSVVISGINLNTASSVMFGDTEAVINGASETELSVSTPAHGAGSVNVTVTNPDGSTVFENGFTYIEIPEPPVYTYCEWHGNSNNWSVLENPKNNKKKKALVCHEQSKPKYTQKTLCLPLEAIPAHLAHGDELGYCGNDDGSGNGKNGGGKDDDNGNNGKCEKGDDKCDNSNNEKDEKSSWKFWKK